MKYILALDIGVASVGWAVLDIESGTVVEACSNIFPEASAAQNQLRREMRQGRRGKRRQRTRLDDFNKLWEKNNLHIPTEAAELPAAGTCYILSFKKYLSVCGI